MILPGRLLGVDYGSRRVGLALCDALGITTRPWQTLDRRVTPKLVATLVALAREEEVAGVVIGLPLRDDGSYGPVARPVRALAAKLAAAFAEDEATKDTLVYLHDESFTSREAEELLVSLGRLPRDASGRPLDRGRIDAAAAALLLEQAIAAWEETGIPTAVSPLADEDDGRPDSGAKITQDSDASRRDDPSLVAEDERATAPSTLDDHPSGEPDDTGGIGRDGRR